jgi:hypothetical protein
LDEAAAQGQFRACQAMFEREVYFGSLFKANVNPALTLALFLKAGRPNVAMLQVPWWTHGRVRGSIISSGARAPVPSGTDGTRWSIGC